MTTRRLTGGSLIPLIRLRNRSSGGNNPGRIRLQTGRASYGYTMGGSTDDNDGIPQVLDPKPPQPAPAEILTSMQIFPTPQGRYIWTAWDWLMTSLGFTMNVSCFIRFPYLCAKYGGVVFLVPYFILTVIVIIPAYYLEVIIGQFTRSSSLNVWKICPLFQGLGWCFLIVNFLSTQYNNTMSTWAIVYILSIFKSAFTGEEYEWSSCNQTWNTKNCQRYDSAHRQVYSSRDSNEEYFRGAVLQQYFGENYTFLDIGPPTIQTLLILIGLMLYTFIASAIGTRCLSRLSALLFQTSTAFLWFLLIRCILLPGGMNGVLYYFSPNFGHLGNFETWLDASAFAFSTYGIGLGVHLTHASFNAFSAPTFGYFLISIITSAMYSIYAAIIVFSLFGFSAMIYGRKFEDMILIRPEFIFTNIPMTLPHQLNCPSYFYLTVIFTIILFTGFLNNIIRLMNMLQCLLDQYQCFAKVDKRYWITLLGIIALSHLFTLPSLSHVGVFWVNLHHDTIDGIVQPFVLLLEMIIFGWIYGVKAINECHISMCGRPVGIIIRSCWKIITPVTVCVLFIAGTTRSYRNTTDQKQKWVRYLGILISIIFILVIVVMAIIKIIKSEQPSSLKIWVLISPEYETATILETKDGERQHSAHYSSFGFSNMKFIKPMIKRPKIPRPRGKVDSFTKLINKTNHEDSEEPLQKVFGPLPDSTNEHQKMVKLVHIITPEETDLKPMTIGRSSFHSFPVVTNSEVNTIELPMMRPTKLRRNPRPALSRGGLLTKK